jgi:adenine-specific DNA-methyltransferase
MALDMTRTDKQRKRLIGLLEELFQLDQPDLDFGFYKIMHAKAQTVSNFVQKDLLEIIKSAFGEADEAKVEEARLKYEQALEQAKSFGAPDPEATEPVQKAKAAYDAAKDNGANEGEIYEHLYRFFERYYDNGDFISRRYFARETGGKAAPYAVPYDGREVYLHWANRDQYYIKTSEYLTNFTFDIAKNFTKEERATYKMPDALKLHCRIVEAAEGEHNNNKTTDKTERFFMICADQPVVMENGELVLQFEYRPDKEKSGTAAKWQEKRIDEAESAVLHALTGIGEAASYNEALRSEIGEDKTKRTLLRKYLNQYTKRNTTDYFIHKDLGSFLKRELDFYIKNEIMRLDDIESADAPHVQAYLDKIKVLRKIAGQLITFLAQLEEFQKKLWLKKKFVTETQYCITLDRIPEDMYAEITANDAQRAEWVALFAIDELDGYGEPLTVDFLKANPFLVLDTAFFNSDFKDAIMAGIQDFDESLDGLLIHSDNEQALRKMQLKHQNNVQCIYIDPPYNTDATPIVYKNNYKSSSWLSLMNSRLECSTGFFSDGDHALCIAIDDTELANLSKLIESHFNNYDLFRVIVNHYPGSGTGRSNVTRTHEYALFAVPKNEDVLRGEEKEDGIRERNFRRSGTGENNYRTGRENSFYAVLVNPNTLEVIGREKPPALGSSYPTDDTDDGLKRIYPIGEDGAERVWTLSYEGFEKAYSEGLIKCTKNMVINRLYKDEAARNLLQSVWLDKQFNAVSNGTNLLKSIFGVSDLFSYPKSLYTVSNAIEAITHAKKDALILDYFAGSGTTGHATITLNRNDNGERKYILVEMGAYFDDVTRPRMQKVIYSQDWKDGKPVSRDGISHAFKYIRLESYEDTLNNLSFMDDAARDQALQSNDAFRRDYMLKYWLEFETKGSPSLLNIEQFDDPTGYKLTLKKPGSDEYEEKPVDLVESFNWLIGLHVDHLDMWRNFHASFKREPDPELPGDDATRLILGGRMEESKDGKWLFRKVEGRVCRTPGDMNNTDRVLVIWRKLTGNLEEDNLMLDEWFKKYRLSTQDSEFDVIYVNGSNNLPNLRKDDEHWKVRLIEEAFHQQMWDVEV